MAPSKKQANDQSSNVSKRSKSSSRASNVNEATSTSTSISTAAVGGKTKRKPFDLAENTTKKGRFIEPELETTQYKDSRLNVGDPVYAPFPGKEPSLEAYYWGLISEKIPDARRGFLYMVDFHDGDKLAKPITSNHLHRLSEAILLYNANMLALPNKPPRQYMEAWDPEEDGELPQNCFEDDDNEDENDEEKEQVMDSGESNNDEPAEQAAGDLFGTVFDPITWDQPQPKGCGDCYQCTTRPPCEFCVACRYNQDKKYKAGSRLRKLCVQKACSNVALCSKWQVCPFLPPGWTFFFDEEYLNPRYAGLSLVRSLKRKYSSFERARNSCGTTFNAYNPKDFYTYVGLGPGSRRPIVELPPPPPSTEETVEDDDYEPGSPVPWTMKEPEPETPEQLPSRFPAENQSWSLKTLQQSRCGACKACLRNDCNICDSCTRWARGECCLRRICTNIEESHRAQPSDYLPPGWKFYFCANPYQIGENKDIIWSKLDGLTIVSPNGFHYYSVESAMRQNPALFRNFPTDVENFYKYVGLELNDDDRLILKCPVVDTVGRDNSANVSDPHLEAEVGLRTAESSEETMSNMDGQALNLAILRRKRCNDCEMCNRVDCGRCYSCKFNRGRSTRHALVCLHKMCVYISAKDKRQAAMGFPAGWYFHFLPERPSTVARPKPKGFQGLVLTSPDNERFTRVKSAYYHCIESTEHGERDVRLSTFCAQIGAAWRLPFKSHPLMSQSFWHEWIRADGSKACLTGQVSKIEHDLVGDPDIFTVTFDEDSRRTVNESSIEILNVPPCLEIDSHYAWDGCLAFQRAIGVPTDALTAEAPFHLQWKTPTMYTRKMVSIEGSEANGQNQLPCIEMAYKGYLLTCKVKQSSIKNSGCGVFLSIKRTVQSEHVKKVFRLEAGELLDIGVYAPYKVSDYRKDHEHLVKSVLHSHKNEIYCFSARDGAYFDITDDVSASLHREAQLHVPPYVNEINDPKVEVPSVVARYDPEGALHYCLGHAEQHQGPFELAADGKELEIFVDYGNDYENVRLREGYPRKKLRGITAEAKMHEEEREFLKEFSTFTASEVNCTLKMLKSLLDCGTDVHPVIDRVVAVAMLMKQRVWNLYEEFVDVGDDESFCDNGVRNQDMELLVQECNEICAVAYSAWVGLHETFEELQSAIADSDLFSDAFLEIFPEVSVSELDSEALRDYVLSLSRKGGKSKCPTMT